MSGDPGPSERQEYKILAIGDLHSGHRVGLTPPFWQQHPDKYIGLREKLWAFYAAEVDMDKPYDLVIVNGDAIDGKGDRSGGTEQITTDRKVQALIAAEAIKYADCKKVRMTYGTPYHAGSQEDHEKDVVTELEKDGYDAEISSQLFLSIYGRQINVKHKIGSSIIPYGRLTALAREILQNRQWYLEGVQPKADIIIRSHVHYSERIEHDDCHGVILPALQGLGSKYGSRQCSGTVHFGITVITIASNSRIYIDVRKLNGQVQAETPECLTVS